MSRPSLHTTAPILLVGAAPAYDGMVSKVLPYVESVIAVDGGLGACRAEGVRPDAVIGDLDSVSADDLDWLGSDRCVQAKDQNQTDLQKALAATQAPLVLAVGFLGGRLDHQMAAMTAILQADKPVILINDTELCFVAPGHLDMHIPDGSPVAFFPLAPCRVETQGVTYPLKDAAMAPDGLISTSNHMNGDRLQVWTVGRGLMVILPVAALDQAISALLPTP